MKLRIIVILSLLLFSCSNEKRTIEETTEKQNSQNDILSEQILYQDSIFEEIEIIDSIETDKKTFDEKLLAFSDSMLRKPTKIQKEVNEFEIISKKNLLSTKVYQKLLITYEYSDEKTAKNIFNAIGKRNVESFWNKAGTLIFQKDNLVIFLVKNCQSPPVSLKWKDYEQLFFKFVLEKNEEIEVLNSSCGDMEFHKEIRKRID